MFRELTRKKQQLSDAGCVEILINEKRGVPSVLGDDGYPYGAPINHYYNPDDEIQRSGPGVRVFELIPEHMTGKIVNEK